MLLVKCKLWYINYKLHLENNKPTIEYSSGTKYWYFNGTQYREDGKPIVIFE